MKKIYITTTLPYINADPHIGHALELVQADTLARYYRQQNYSVFFNTGTDEHGSKIFNKAQENNLDPQTYCDIYFEKFKKLKDVLNLSYNSFIRTTDTHHIKAAQDFWLRCKKNNDIYKKNYEIKYCIGCELEKTDSDLINNKCPHHPDKELETIKEENYFFRYSKYKDKLLKLYQDNPEFVLPKERLNEIYSFTEKGLKDFSVSRLKEKMPWGIPVPGDSNHVIYVWFDALINYISCLGWPDELDKFNDFWPGIQIAGKDNLRQQSSMWQAMLMSANLPNSKKIFIHGFITCDGQKMSKSLGNVVNPQELVDKYGVDALRYYLLREISSTEDGDFSESKFKQRYNSDLASGIGNLTARIVTLSKKISNTSDCEISQEVLQEIEKTTKKIDDSLIKFKFNFCLSEIWNLIKFTDQYIDKNKPWHKESDNQKQIISDLVFILKKIAEMIQSFMPGTSQEIIKQIKEKESRLLFKKIN